MRSKKPLLIIVAAILAVLGLSSPGFPSIGFEPPTNYASTNPTHMVTADLNGDGKADMVVTNWSANTITVFLGNGDGTFTAQTPVDAGVHSNSIATGFFNDDANLDLAVAKGGSPRNVMLLLGNGSGGFSSVTPVDVTNNGSYPFGDADVNYVVSGDFDNDGETDLAISKNSGYPEINDHIKIMKGNGAGGFIPLSTTNVGNSATGPLGLATGYFNGDTNLDLAVTLYDSGTIKILLGDGSGGFAEAPGSPIAVGTLPVYVVNADVNTDGNADLIVTNNGSNTLTVLLGNGDGTFTQASGSPIATGTSPGGIIAAQMGPDTNMDLVVANGGASSFSVFEGNGDGTFQARQDFLTGAGPAFLQAGDFDSDGKTDLAVANSSGNTVSVFRRSDCIFPLSGMIAWWSGDGNATDAVGPNDGSLENGATYAVGMVGQAFSFNGVNAYVEIPNSSSLNPGGAFSVDGWFYIDPSANAGKIATLVAKTEGSTGNGWALYFDDRAGVGSSKSLKFVLGSVIEVTNAIPSAGWYHIAGVYDPLASPQATIYLNGSSIGSANCSGATPNSLNVRIGAMYWTDSYGQGNDRLNGKADEVKFYDRALSDAEIRAMFNSGSAGLCKSCAAPPSGMVSWWKAESTADDSVGANNGALQNGATFAAGVIGQGFSFDGVDDDIVIPHNDALNATTITVDAWIKTPGTGDNQLIADKSHGTCFGGGGDNSGWVLHGDAPGTVSFSYGNGGASWSGVGAVSSTLVTDNKWHHLAGTFDGTTIKIYIDGVMEASTAYSGTPQTNTRDMHIGRWYNTAGCSRRPFSGLIDELKIFNRALSASEIGSIYSCSADTTPTAFTFTDVTGANLETVYTSDTITVGGLNTPASISVVGGEYEINGSGTWSGAPGMVFNRDTVRVRLTSSGSYNTKLDAMVSIGTVSDTFSVTTIAGADLSISVTDTGYDPAGVGGTIIYTVTVTNSGSDTATNVTMTDTLPAGVTDASAPLCSYNPELNEVSCWLVNIPAGESRERTVTVTAPSAPGVITNTVSVTSDTADPDSANNTATQDTTVRTTLSISIEPDSGSGTVTGTGINCGNGNTDCSEAFSSATDVSLTATAAAGWRFLRWEGSLTGSANPDSVSMDGNRSVTAVFATDRTVCTDPLVCFTTIQAAIDAANTGDVVKVPQGTYYENIVIDTAKELTISGGWNSEFTTQTPDPSLTVISGDTDHDSIGNGPVFSITAGSSIALENLTLANGNSASGGGVKIESSDGPVSLSLTNMIINDNVAGDGAGVFTSSTAPTTPISLNVVNTIIARNWTASRGGGIAAFASSDGTVTVNVTNSTITDNRAVEAGAGTSFMVVETGSVTASVANSVIWGNLLSGTLVEDDVFADGASVSASHSDIGAGTFTDLGNNIGLDPVFLDPALLDYRLNSDSAAIDAGDNASASGLSADIMGQSRVAGGTVDMGAHEYQPTTPTAIKLLSLNGGEVIDAGMPYDITWEAPASALSFKVFYSMDNGLTWVKAVSADPEVTGNIVTGQQHFRWDVPVQPKNKKCKVKVIGYSAVAKVGTDISDLPFVLRAASLVRPNGPDPLHYGETYIIRWITTERPKAEVTTVKLSYTADGGLTWKAIGSPISGNAGSYSWTVPTLTKPKTKCKVKVDLYSDTAKVGSDISDYFFKIGP